MLRRSLASLGSALVVGVLATACNEVEPPDGALTAPAPSASATAWNGFTAVEDLCARLDWARLDSIDVSPSNQLGAWSFRGSDRSVTCRPDLDSTEHGSDIGLMWVTTTIYDSDALAEAAIAADGRDFSDSDAPWTQDLLYSEVTDVEFTGRTDNLIVKVSLTLDADVAGVYEEGQLATIATGLAEDAYDLCRIGS